MGNRHRKTERGQDVSLHGILILVCAAAVMLSSGCSQKEQNNSTPPDHAVPVSVATVMSRQEPVEVKAIGTVEAYSTVSVRSMVGGELLKAHFTEGQKITKGSLLFEIDPRPYEADLQRNEANLAGDMDALAQAKANLAKDTAQSENASLEQQRYHQLVEKGVAAKEQSDQMKANADAAAAAVRADEAAIGSAENAIRADRAAVEQARIQLGYCKIYSPIDGHAGSLAVQPGNIVKANDIPMVVINQVQPIYAEFTLPESYLPEIRRRVSEGKIRVQAVSPNGAPSEGTLTFVNNTVDTTTGTIQLKATFPNADERLWPGQFVDIVATLSYQPNAIVVPNEAIQSGQNGSFVFVVKPDMTVEARSVEQGRVVGNDTIIEKGLRPGEKVVTDGQLRLTPGAKIQIKEALKIEPGNAS